MCRHTADHDLHQHPATQARVREGMASDRQSLERSQAIATVGAGAAAGAGAGATGSQLNAGSAAVTGRDHRGQGGEVRMTKEGLPRAPMPNPRPAPP